MLTKKISGVVLLLLGTVLLMVGISQYNKSCTPNSCIVSFSRSLGGKASLAFENSIQRAKYYGIAGISVGAVLILAGGVLILKSKK
ncbi:MAG: hypothetical protein U9Q61_02745 [Thermodesulfobacteriota bacterium]|nr:hypothetical protein [Thermodesulfobacteriota bacterium]